MSVFFVCPIIFPGYLYATVGEPAVIQIILNEEDKGAHFIFITTDSVPIIPEKTLIAFGFTGDISGGIAIGGVEYVSLEALYPEVTYVLNEIEGVLKIKSRPGMFMKQIIDYSRKPDVEIVETTRNSAFINYDANYTYTENNGAESGRLSLPSELGIKLGDYFAYSNFLYTYVDSPNIVEELTRIRTNITKDNTKAMRRYIIGDVSAYSGEGGSGMDLGGISISKNFSLSPYFLKIPSLELTGTLYTPSEVNVYVNGVLTRRERLQPGSFELLNIPPVSGPGEVMLEIKDAYGSIIRTTDLYYLSSNQLKVGLHEYSYNLGAKRVNLGGREPGYEDLAFLGFHRVGVSKNLTIGLRAEGDSELTNMGANFTFVTGAFGEMALFADGSRRNGKQGTRGSFRYRYYPMGTFTAMLQATGYDVNYETLASALLIPGQRPKYEVFSSASVSPGRLGSISVSYSYEKLFDESEQKTARASYNMRLIRNLNIIFTASRSMRKDTVTDTYLAQFNYYIGGGKSLNVNTQVNEGQTSTAMDFQKNPDADMGSGYRFGATDIQSVNGRSAAWNGEVENRAARAVYKLRYSGNDAGSNRYNPDVAGSVALIDGGIYLGRPIRDSFALVKTHAIKGLPIERSNQKAGITNKDGDALVPGLISYYNNKISLGTENLPLEYVLEGDDKQYVKPGYRGGSVVEFRISRLQAFEGRLFFIEKGEKTAAQYAGLEITLDGEIMEIFTGANGEFYMENIPPGEYTARLFDDKKECEIRLTVPESDKMIVDMGEVSCEIR
ncbi:MAG: hypothetical protein IEMM0002_0196 [bacterium]|nr:MAG: hypothetical protein IEMM0002_0196 [bacterium]